MALLDRTGRKDVPTPGRQRVTCHIAQEHENLRNVAERLLASGRQIRKLSQGVDVVALPSQSLTRF